MIHPNFQPYYWNGTKVMTGDRVLSAGPPERIITAVFEPDHEISKLYNMINGCVEISPATIEPLPLNEDIDFVARADKS